MNDEQFVMYHGDCRDLLRALPDEFVDLILSSPPYFMGKEYDRSVQLSDFVQDHEALAPELIRTLRANGNLAWQVGNYVRAGAVTPLDFVAHSVFGRSHELVLRNRIMWTFGHGAHATKRFSGRHETILWYSKGEEYFFDLDAVRVPQKYPGKRHYKGPKKGQWSGNPLGKNPSDVWDIPNVNANHVEKSGHPCQFPIALAMRVIAALCKSSGLVLDPFAGSGSSAVAAHLLGRRFLGAELNLDYCRIAEERYKAAIDGALRYRPLEQEIFEPRAGTAVATRPSHFRG